ncbi:MAG: DUF2806 domain-containing protein [Pseudomonadales bacterium]|nr:DUF2806 domain-containing protein [Pseudomonadales bacterium]
MSEANVPNKYLGKLWKTLFDEHTAGLLSPEQITRESRTRLHCRSDELVLIRRIERDAYDIREGKKEINEVGRVVTTETYMGTEDIKLSPIIVTEGHGPTVTSLGLTFSSMYSAVKRNTSLLDLLRALTIRRIYIFAEAKAAIVNNQAVMDTTVDRQWVLRWQQAAQDVRSETLQLMWAKVLGAEVVTPGTFSLRAIDCLSQMSEREVEMLHIISRLSMGGVICREATGYFKEEIHGELFEKLEELGVIFGVRYGNCSTQIKSQSNSSFKAVLRCQNKAIYIQHDLSDSEFEVPIYGITSHGKAIMSLGKGDADMGYLWAVSSDLKARGYQVSLGDWVGDDDAGLYSARVES